MKRIETKMAINDLIHNIRTLKNTDSDEEDWNDSDAIFERYEKQLKNTDSDEEDWNMMEAEQLTLFAPLKNTDSDEEDWNVENYPVPIGEGLVVEEYRLGKRGLKLLS